MKKFFLVGGGTGGHCIPISVLYSEIIKKSEVKEIIIGHVELTLIFLFDDFLCKIASFYNKFGLTRGW